MMKFLMKFFLFIALSGFASITSFAQESNITKVPKFKPPAVKSYLGINTTGASVTIDEANQLIALPLKITDDAKNVYSVQSYGFVYRRKGVVQDEETGRKNVTFTTLADKFQTTPLPKVWVDNLKNGFQKDEQLYFYDILVKDDKGRKFFAPDLKITLK